METASKSLPRDELVRQNNQTALEPDRAEPVNKSSQNLFLVCTRMCQMYAKDNFDIEEPREQPILELTISKQLRSENTSETRNYKILILS